MKQLTDSQRNTKAMLALAAGALGLTIASGAVYGRWTQRWGASVDLQAAGAELAKMPQQIGDWRMLIENPLPDAVAETLECAGYANRVYVNQTTGARVNVALIVGPPGPTSVHTPEICFSSRNYETPDPPKKWLFKPTGGTAHSFWWMTFRSRNAGSGQLRVYYGWSRGGEWTASDFPRFEYGGSPLLYKIQLSSEVESGEDEANDPCRSLIDALVKEYWQANKT